MAGKPVKKPRKVTRDAIIQIRVTDEVKAALIEAAERSGLTLSAWITSTCVRVARAEREKAARAPE